eukprot:gb/GECG01002807.1/.p1 GENE.gb/GECG01002807.1/~~gb/GECG01002807.1/.p1  ORF type:complete len:285 (+),score=35.45 gb/GECG01002807.1/:1-855(+)
MAPRAITAKHLSGKLREVADSKLVPFYSRFFKTAKGQYAEGDKFLGLRVPWIRKIVSQKDFVESLSLSEVDKLLSSEYHEERLGALLVLVYRWPRASKQERKEIYEFYLNHTKFINNWDLVDTTAPKIVGAWLYETKSSRDVLYRLAKSEDLWERRIGMLSTHYFIGKGDLEDALSISALLLQDTHDLIHKACGWMLREVGKKDVSKLEEFLDEHCRVMPRVMLRYSIERLPASKRKAYLRPDEKQGKAAKRNSTSTSKRKRSASEKHGGAKKPARTRSSQAQR